MKSNRKERFLARISFLFDLERREVLRERKDHDKGRKEKS
jgi:hypothetical protein